MAKSEKREVKVWSSIGATLPIPDTYANIKFSFGHERYAKSDNHNDLSDTEEEIHLFNLKVLNRRLEEFRIELANIVLEEKKSKKKGKKK